MRLLSITFYVLAALPVLGLLFFLAGLVAGLGGWEDTANAIFGVLAPMRLITVAPAVFVGTVIGFNAPAPERDIWKASFEGCPRWMGYLHAATWVLLPVLFFWNLFPWPKVYIGPSSPLDPVLYTIALAILTTGARVGLKPRRCVNGHAMTRRASLCSRCGAVESRFLA